MKKYIILSIVISSLLCIAQIGAISSAAQEEIEKTFNAYKTQSELLTNYAEIYPNDPFIIGIMNEKKNFETQFQQKQFQGQQQPIITQSLPHLDKYLQNNTGAYIAGVVNPSWYTNMLTFATKDFNAGAMKGLEINGQISLIADKIMPVVTASAQKNNITITRTEINTWLWDNWQRAQAQAPQQQQPPVMQQQQDPFAGMVQQKKIEMQMEQEMASLKESTTLKEYKNKTMSLFNQFYNKKKGGLQQEWFNQAMRISKQESPLDSESTHKETIENVAKRLLQHQNMKISNMLTDDMIKAAANKAWAETQ